MPKKIKIDYEQVKSQYLEGLSCQSIAVRLGVSKQPIQTILKSLGLLRQGRSSGKKIQIEESKLELIKNMYINEYKTLSEIADAAQLSESLVDKLLTKSGYRRSKSEGVSVGLVKRYRDMNYNDYLSQMEDYYKYELDVLKITRQQDIKSMSNYTKRGNSGIEDAYHLDHKYSIVEGFKNNIPPIIIGSLLNLEFIPWKTNINKRAKCSITKEELINNYYG